MGPCHYFAISLLPAERCLRCCFWRHGVFLKRKSSTAPTWRGRSFELLPTGWVRRGLRSIPVFDLWSFLLHSRIWRSKHRPRRRSRKPNLAHRPRHPQRPSRPTARRRSQRGRTARGWLPIRKDPSPSVQPGGHFSLRHLAGHPRLAGQRLRPPSISPNDLVCGACSCVTASLMHGRQPKANPSVRRFPMPPRARPSPEERTGS